MQYDRETDRPRIPGVLREIDDREARRFRAAPEETEISCGRCKISPFLFPFFFLDKDLTGYEQEISAIDIFCLPYGHYMTEGGYDYLKSDKWPNVARWWADISTRPSWQLVKNGIPEEYNGE